MYCMYNYVAWFQPYVLKYHMMHLMHCDVLYVVHSENIVQNFDMMHLMSCDVVYVHNFNVMFDGVQFVQRCSLLLTDA